MAGGRGRGLGPNRLAEIFTPPEYENIWDDPQYAWSKPTDTALRDYLTGSDYWGYKDWAPGEADLRDYARHGDVFGKGRGGTGGYAERTPEYRAYRRLLKQTSSADKMALWKGMGEDWKKYNPGVKRPSFTLLQKLRYLEGQGTNVPISYTDAPGYDRFGNVKGGRGGDRPGPKTTAPPVTPRPQYTAPQAAAPMRPRGQSRTLGPRGRPQLMNRSTRSLADIFNGTGGRRW